MPQSQQRMTKSQTIPTEFKVAGIDGDVLVYRAAFKAQYTLYTLRLTSTGEVLRQDSSCKSIKEWQELSPSDTYIEHEVFHRDKAIAIAAVDRLVSEIRENTKAKAVHVYLSGDSNFRVDAATIAPYKGNRVAEKPFHYDTVRTYLQYKYPCTISDYCEADDLLSIDLINHSEDFILCTIDKDLDNTPGWHYNLNKKKTYYISDKEALLKFYTQMLTGDVTDNIKGLHGYGAAKAARTLQYTSYKDMSLDTVHMNLETKTAEAYMQFFRYKKTHDWMKSFLENGRLLHMQRYKDELWYPKYITFEHNDN